ncbi:unnamed protein product, partial [Amoebophrya sp. A120]|eukprot:GSA120T00014649001.1
MASNINPISARGLRVPIGFFRSRKMTWSGRRWLVRNASHWWQRVLLIHLAVWCAARSHGVEASRENRSTRASWCEVQFKLARPQEQPSILDPQSMTWPEQIEQSLRHWPVGMLRRNGYKWWPAFHRMTDNGATLYWKDDRNWISRLGRKFPSAASWRHDADGKWRVLHDLPSPETANFVRTNMGRADNHDGAPIVSVNISFSDMLNLRLVGDAGVQGFLDSSLEDWRFIFTSNVPHFPDPSSDVPPPFFSPVTSSHRRIDVRFHLPPTFFSPVNTRAGPLLR